MRPCLLPLLALAAPAALAQPGAPFAETRPGPESDAIGAYVFQQGRVYGVTDEATGAGYVLTPGAATPIRQTPSPFAYAAAATASGPLRDLYVVPLASAGASWIGAVGSEAGTTLYALGASGAPRAITARPLNGGIRQAVAVGTAAYALVVHDDETTSVMRLTPTAATRLPALPWGTPRAVGADGPHLLVASGTDAATRVYRLRGGTGAPVEVGRMDRPWPIDGSAPTIEVLAGDGRGGAFVFSDLVPTDDGDLSARLFRVVAGGRPARVGTLELPHRVTRVNVRPVCEGGRCAFVASEGDAQGLYVLDVATGRADRLLALDRNTEVSARSLAFGPDGLYATISTAEHGREPYRFALPARGAASPTPPAPQPSGRRGATGGPAASAACTAPRTAVADLVRGDVDGLSSRIRLSSVRAAFPCVQADRYDEAALVAMGTPDRYGNERRLMGFSPTTGWWVEEGFGGTVRPAVLGLTLARARALLERNGLRFFGTLGEGGSAMQFTAPYGCARISSGDDGRVTGVGASDRACTHPDD